MAKMMKKSAKKAKAVKKAPAKAKVAVSKKPGAVKKLFTKTEVLRHLATSAELSTKQVGVVMQSLSDLINAHLTKGGAGVFVLPGLAKIQVINKPAVKARKGINPFTGEPTTFKAKPARNVVKVRPLKKLKEMVA